MNPDDPQTVTEDQATADTPNEGKEAAPEATGAQDTTETDWEALLEDSQTETDKAKPEPKAEPDELKTLREEFDNMKANLSKKDVNEGIATAVGRIKAGNEALKDMPDRAVRSYLYGLAEEHPEVLTAFGNRHQNPKAWTKAQDMIGKEMAKDFADMPDADLTAGVKAAADAVRGVSTTLPAKEEHDNKHYAKMSDTEFSASIKEELEPAGG